MRPSITAVIQLALAAACSAYPNTVEQHLPGGGDPGSTVLEDSGRADHEEDAGGGDVRTLALNPLGLITQPNKHGQYPVGALSTAKNVCIRDRGIVSSLPDTQVYLADEASGYAIRRIFAGDASLLVLAVSGSTWAARWVTTANNAINAPAGYTLDFDNQRAQLARARDRFFLSSSTGVLALDSEGDTSARWAGIVPANGGVNAYSAATAEAIANGQSANYAFIFRRKQSDGYETIGAPGATVYVENTTGAAANLDFIVWLHANSGIVAGDLIEIYRTTTQTIGVDPGNVYKLSVQYSVVAADLVTGYAIVTEKTPNAGLGVELYTNPGVAGENGPNFHNFIPPRSVDVASFNSYMFYFNTTLAASISLRIPSTIGALSTATERTRGIGDRSATGALTAGSPTMTGIAAANLVGVVAGQEVVTAQFPGLTTVSSVGAASITFSANSTVTGGAEVVTVSDVIELSGTTVSVIPRTLQHLASRSQQNGYDFFSSVPVTTNNEVGASFTIARQRASDGTFAIRATNGQNYDPVLPQIAGTALTVERDEKNNRFYWSKNNQPEAVPPTNLAYVGHEKIYRALATEDVIYVFASDGLWMISGNAGVWQVDLLDASLILAASNAADVLDGTVWAYTNRGVVSIAGSVVTSVSDGIVGDSASLPGADFSSSWLTFLACDALHKEVWLTFNAVGSSLTYVYNTITGAFTTFVDDEWTSSAFAAYLRSLVVGINPSGIAEVRDFRNDSSAVRLAGAVVNYQPVTMGDPFALKEFVDAEYIFDGVSASVVTITPKFDGTDYTNLSVPINTVESHVVAPIPRNAPALGTRITPGFSAGTNSTENLWRLLGMAVRWNAAAEEGAVR